MTDIDQFAVLHNPVLLHQFVGLCLSLRKLFLAHLGACNRVLHEAFPSLQVLSVEEADESLLVRIGSLEPVLCLVPLLEAEHGQYGRECLACVGTVIFGMIGQNRPDGLGGGIGRLFVLELGSGESQSLVGSRLCHEHQSGIALFRVACLLVDVTQIECLVLGRESLCRNALAQDKEGRHHDAGQPMEHVYSSHSSVRMPQVLFG